jgi:hypothetical protein
LKDCRHVAICRAARPRAKRTFRRAVSGAQRAFTETRDLLSAKSTIHVPRKPARMNSRYSINCWDSAFLSCHKGRAERLGEKPISLHQAANFDRDPSAASMQRNGGVSCHLLFAMSGAQCDGAGDEVDERVVTARRIERSECSRCNRPRSRRCDRKVVCRTRSTATLQRRQRSSDQLKGAAQVAGGGSRCVCAWWPPQMATISECRYRWLRLHDLNLRRIHGALPVVGCQIVRDR